MSSINSKNNNTTAKKDNGKNNDTRDIKRILITSAIVNAIVVTVVIVFSFIAISRAETRETYTKLVLLPIAAFVGSFISVLLNKDLIMNLAGCAAVMFLAYLIFVKFSFMVIPWLILYAASAIIGILSSYIARTFRFN